MCVPAEAMSAVKLVVVGRPMTNHPNEVLLSGHDKYVTAAAWQRRKGEYPKLPSGIPLNS